MGPRHDGRGKRREWRAHWSIPSRFNGATPRWAWKTRRITRGSSATGRLQWGHATMGVENIMINRKVASLGTLQWGHATMGVENAKAALVSRIQDVSFNGATPRWAWKTAQTCAIEHSINASMGPRHDGRGKPAARRAAPGLSQSFNGATPRWAWKTPKPSRLIRRLVELQWGHATMGVENGLVRARLPRLAGASMGPRHDGRGKRRRSTSRRRACSRFNGATPRWAWKTSP